MKRVKIWLLVSAGVFCCFSIAFGQIYLEATGGIKKVNICNCMIDDIAPIGTGAIAVAPSQNPYYLDGDQIFEYNLTTGTSTLIGAVSGGANNLVVSENGLIYLVGDNVSGTGSFLGVLNPSTGVFTNLGDLPPGLFPSGDLFFYAGNLYMLGELIGGIDIGVYQIPIANPSATSFVIPLPTIINAVGAVSFYIGGVQTVFISGFVGSTEGVYTLDMVTGNLTLACPVSLSISDMGAWSGLQLPPCCTNNAGNFQSLNLIQACQNQPITVTHLGDQMLNTGSALSFALVADSMTALPGGIIQISASPTFSFNSATMNVNTVYFVVAIAAPGTPGAPDWSSNCIDLSYFAKVVWRPVPTVTYSGSPPQVCANGCATFALTFTGAFPVSLTWSVNLGSQVLTGVFTANSANQTLTVCPPAGQSFPTGGLTVQFVSISDAFCTCP